MKRDAFRTATFRLTLLTAPLFLLAGWGLVAFVFFSTQAIMEHRVDVALGAESERLAAEWQAASPADVARSLEARIFAERGSSRLYRLSGPDGRPAVENFTLVDGAAPAPGRFADVTMRRGATDGEHQARLLAVARPDGAVLILGRDLTEADEVRRIVGESSLAAAVAMAFLSVLAGFVTSRAVMRRLAAFNASAHRILNGHLDERMPVGGGGDEFDRLGLHLNAALDRIADLMTATREVTDNIAHDLRGPLSRLRGRLELLQIEAPPPAERDAALAAAVGELDTLLETLEALLSIARIDHGEAVARERVDIARLVDDLVDYFRPLAEDGGVRLDTAVEGRPMVEGDRHLLFQALSNVVDNAVGHTPSGGRIVVAAARRGETVALRVTDSGPGIAPADRARVLERFVRLDASRHRRGSGLGLSVVDAVVRHHGGRLELGDAAPGLVVTMSLPAAD